MPPPWTYVRLDIAWRTGDLLPGDWCPAGSAYEERGGYVDVEDHQH